MALLKTLIATLIMPLPGVLLLALIGALVWWRSRPRPAALLLGGAGVLLLLASWGPVADGLLVPLEHRYAAVLNGGEHGDVVAVVVLGSGYYPNRPLPVTSQLNDSGLVRLVEGIRLHRQVEGARLVVSGGARGAARSISSGYAEAASALGVRDEAIVELDWPLDTAQEAYATRELLGEGATLLLVTSASHMPRAMRHFRQVGLNPIAAPTRHKSGMPPPDRLGYWVPGAGHLRKTERAVYEYMGLVSFRLDH